MRQCVARSDVIFDYLILVPRQIAWRSASARARPPKGPQCGESLHQLLQIGPRSPRQLIYRSARLQHLKAETENDRTLTDACLDAERVAGADADGAAATATARQELDALIERDRMRADAKLLKFRAGVDRALSRERSDTSAADMSVDRERDSAALRTYVERDVTDALLQQERQRAD